MPIPIFDEQRHKYTTPEGIELPGVTTILGEYHRVRWGRSEFYVAQNGITIDVATMNRAAEYGSAVHKILELSVLHGVGSFDYPEEMSHAVQQIASFIADYQPEVVMCEQPLYSEKGLFAGTGDLFFRSPKIRNGKRLCLLDAKTGAGLFTGPQTAAYESLYREETGEKGLIDRFKLQLPKDGKPYKMIPLTNQKDMTYFNYRLYCRSFEQNL